jgi:hypothetical protein
MSITKLKTLGSWQPTRWDGVPVEGQANIRGRIITGILTGADPDPDELAAAQDLRAERTR